MSERPKVQLSKSCVGLKPTVGSNPTGTARYEKKTVPTGAVFFVSGGPQSRGGLYMNSMRIPSSLSTNDA